MRGWAKIGLAMAAALAAATAPAQDLGGGSDGEAFLQAVENRDNSKAVPLLLDPGSRVANYRGYKGDTALHIVTARRDTDWVVFLLQKGADPNIGDAKGDTALHIAARIGFDSAIESMLSRGAKVDLANRRGETALNLAVQQRQRRAVELLLTAGANPDKADHVAGLTPRDYARRDTRNPQLLKLIETVKSTKKKVAGPSLN